MFTRIRAMSKKSNSEDRRWRSRGARGGERGGAAGYQYLLVTGSDPVSTYFSFLYFGQQGVVSCSFFLFPLRVAFVPVCTWHFREREAVDGAIVRCK